MVTYKDWSSHRLTWGNGNLLGIDLQDSLTWGNGNLQGTDLHSLTWGNGNLQGTDLQNGCDLGEL